MWITCTTSLRGQLCAREGWCCAMFAGRTTHWIRTPYAGCRRILDSSGISFRCKSPFIGVGGLESYWLSAGQEQSLLKVRVAADYSDSVSGSSKYGDHCGYHHLEEIKECEKDRDLHLTDAEIARTTIEAHDKALVVFPGRVHCEPHGHASWAEFHYVVDDYGDIFFEFFDDENILQDRDASNPVTVLIGMDNPIYVERMVPGNFIDYLDADSTNNIQLFDGYDEVSETDITDTLIRWGMPDTLRWIHPKHFAKCLTKAVHTKYQNMMEHPSNGLCFLGCLRPAFIDEESYLRRLFHREISHGYLSDGRDGDILNFSSKNNGGSISSTLYRLEIMTLELFSVYGDRTVISLQDFEDAEPDVLAQSASAIISRFTDYELQCSSALRTLCRKKKGVNVEEASLIGVDSLGMDVRVISGVEARTLRFSFNARAMSESAAEKKIRRMLFPRYYRRNSKKHRDVSIT